MTTTLLPVLLLLVAVAMIATAWAMGRPARRRQQAIRELLDSADKLEARLRTARSEIEAVAGDHENPVRGAMQEILRQRLWPQEHGNDASLEHLRAMRGSLDAASASLEQQLLQVSAARGG